MSEQHQEHVSHEPQHQEVYEVTDSTPAATRIAVLENEVSSLKSQLNQAQQQANMVPELLGLMARLAARYMPDENGNVSISLPVLSSTQQALFTAASRLLPVSSLGHHAPESPDEALAAAHAAGLSYPAADVSSGLADSPHPAMQHAADQLAQFLALQGGGAFDALKKRKSDGAPSFGRGAPGQKRFCPLCKNSDGTPTPLAGNHNATCPWCKKCWARKQQQQQQSQHHTNLSHHHQHQAEAMDHQQLPDSVNAASAAPQAMHISSMG
ncbi:hypothetical protein WJX73_008725 [Symbiochloris irregularis]|uniref:Uncharacterized protein n=1 Tax=Symbiochloris irregularis TaxID=706552 RepID=A0AAW1PBL8_9CHLO